MEIKKEIIKEYIETEIKYHCDVLVAGGGVAGIAAALAAARSGAEVILCEREFALGGLATYGLVTIYLPLCDGCGRQVSFGIAEELLRLSIKHGAQDRYPKAWFDGGNVQEKSKNRFEVQYNPSVFETLAEQLLIKEGVKILYATAICAADVSNGRIGAVITESKGGRSAIAVKNVIDATGDADVAHLSGQSTAKNVKGNPLAAWYYGAGAHGMRLNMLGYADIPEDCDESVNVSPLVKRKFEGLDAEEITEFMLQARSQILNDVLKKRDKDSTLEAGMTPVIPQLRMTRRINGKFEMKMQHCNTHFDDSVGMIGSWRKSGPVIEIPYSALYGTDIKNLITAGRCISSSGDMWDLTRVIPACAVTGQAAGVAAAMGGDFENIDVCALQSRLEQADVRLHISQL